MRKRSPSLVFLSVFVFFAVSELQAQLILLTQNDVSNENKTVTISCNNTYNGYVPLNAIDGDESTKWIARSTTSVLTINFQSSYYLSSFSIMPNGGNPGETSRFELWGRENGGSYERLYTDSGSLATGTTIQGEGYTTITLAGVENYQYLQVIFTGGTGWASAKELNVWGSVSAIPEPATAGLLLGIGAFSIVIWRRRKVAKGNV